MASINYLLDKAKNIAPWALGGPLGLAIGTYLNRDKGGMMFPRMSQDEIQKQVAGAFVGPNNPQDTTDPFSTGGGGGGFTSKKNMQMYNGRWYDLNSPEGLDAYNEAYQSDIDYEYKKALKSGDLQYASQLADLDYALTAISENKADYLRNWGKQESDLTEGYNLGITKRQNMFAGLGPRAYQSSMGTSGNYALGKYNEGEQDLAMDKKAALAQFAQASAKAKQAKKDLGTAWSTFKEDTARQAQGQMDQFQTGLAASPNFNFKAPSVSIPMPKATDLSAYTPYTNFNELMSSPGYAETAAANNAGQKYIGGSGKSGNALESYLGYKETNPESELNNPLIKFLYGR